MTTKQMDYILELAETKNFNRAAENLFVSQPTMTYQIRTAEEEIGFRLFDRSGKGAALTPAGEQFVISLRSIRDELKRAIEQGQNFSTSFRENIRMALPIRSALQFLPDAIIKFQKEYPSVEVSLTFDWEHCLDSFLRGEQDILFAMESDVKHIPDIILHKIFDSGIYLVTQNHDPLSKKKLIHYSDMKGRTLMVGGGSPAILKKVQQQAIAEAGLNYFNSHDHDTTLVYIAS